jgi:hypothetical protein
MQVLSSPAEKEAYDCGSPTWQVFELAQLVPSGLGSGMSLPREGNPALGQPSARPMHLASPDRRRCAASS